MNFFHVALVASTLLAASYALPGGAPETCCVNMLPVHGAVEPQTDPAPFEILASRNADGTYAVELKTTTAPQFRGFLLQARQESSGTIVGGFTSIPAEEAQYLNCLVADNSVTHTGIAAKTSLSFTWDPRGADVTGVVFVSTFVQNTITFWTFVRSAELSTL